MSKARLGYGLAMLSVVIETDGDEEALARTLASLVPGAVEGAVREVIVCDRGASAATRGVAEQTGCAYLANTNASGGVARARGDWLLLLEPGAKLLEGWIEAALDHVGNGEGAARFTRSRHSRLPLLARLFSARLPLAEGLLVRRQAIARGEGDAAGIARGVSARRLHAEIVVAPN